MTSTDFNIVVEKQFKKCQEVLGAKNTEYTPSDTDRLSYFRKAADLMDVSPKKALFGMLAKHLISISLLEIAASLPLYMGVSVFPAAL